MTVREVWLRLLAFWAVLAFTHPGIVPIQIATVGGAFLVAAVLATNARTRITIPTLAVALIVLAALSPLWAPALTGYTASGFTLSWSVFFAVVTIAGAVFAHCTTPKSGLRFFDAALKSLAVLTVVMIAIVPSEAFDQRAPNAGTLAGPFTHKNLLGPLLVLGLLSALYAGRGFRRACWVGLYVLLVMLTSSSSALVLSLLMLIMFVLIKGWYDKRIVILTAILAGLFAWLLVQYQDTLLAAVGRDATLSGRDRIWAGTIDAWQDRPLLGYGWYFTYTEGSPAAHIIEHYAGWLVPSSHNGFLSMLLQLGIVGASVLLTITAVTFLKLFRLVTMTADREARWALQAVVVFLMINLIDKNLDSTAWFIFVASATWLGNGWCASGSNAVPPTLESESVG